MKKLMIVVLCLTGAYSGNKAAEASYDDLRQQLVEAATTGDLDEVRKLIKAGADVNAVYEIANSKLTPLTLAATYGHKDIIAHLLSNGADPNLTHKGVTDNGFSPLQWAVCCGKIPPIIALLRAGADLSYVNEEDGSTVLDSVRDYEVKNFIQDAIEKRKKEVKKEILRTTPLPPDVAQVISEFIYGRKKRTSSERV